MKQTSLLLTLLAVAIPSCASVDNSTSDPAPQTAADMPGDQEMPMPQPTPEHLRLAEAVGEWSGHLTMSVPGVPGEPMACSETIEAFGPFWITSEFRSDFMGMPFQGRATQGYDVMRGKYVGTWMDTMSGFMANMEGNYNEDGDLVMEWEAPDMTGQMAPHRSVTTHNGNQVTMRFWTNEEPTMVIEMTRQ